jgi:hypothetical protein
MEIQPRVDLTKYQFIDEGIWLFSRFNYFLYRLMGMAEVYVPVVEKGFRGLLQNIGLGEYQDLIDGAARLLGINTENNAPMLKWHDKRLRNLIRQYIPAVAIFLSFFLFVISDAVFAVSERYLNFLILDSSFIGIYFALFIIFVSRIFVLFLRKNYADTLSAVNGIYLVLELFHPDGISTPTHRKRIQTRLNFLSNSILLLAQRYRSSSTENERVIYRHFHAMESYIRERERWVVLPKENTLADLRKDFVALLPILINGNYGDFSGPITEIQEVLQEIPYWRRIAGGILAFIGLVIPIVSLVNLYVLKSKDFLPTNADPNTFTAIMAAWLLLTLDSILKLGLIETFTNLVKSVRDLR